MDKKFSCIVPAYNEERYIGNVLEVLTEHPLIDEVIVVDDGSHDGTANVATKFKVSVISQKNQGKSASVINGIRAAKNDYIVLIDADLIGLTTEGVSALLDPVLNAEADISISLRKNSYLFYRMIGLDFVAGERAFKREFIEPYLDEISKLKGFGLEVFLNNKIIQEKLKIKVVYLKTLISPRKSVKIGFFRGRLDDLKMAGQILKTISIFDIVRQNVKMRSQRV